MNSDSIKTPRTRTPRKSLKKKHPPKLSPRKKIKKGNFILEVIEDIYNFAKEINKITGGLFFVFGSIYGKNFIDYLINWYFTNIKLNKIRKNINEQIDKIKKEKNKKTRDHYLTLLKDSNDAYQKIADEVYVDIAKLTEELEKIHETETGKDDKKDNTEGSPKSLPNPSPALSEAPPVHLSFERTASAPGRLYDHSPATAIFSPFASVFSPSAASASSAPTRPNSPDLAEVGIPATPNNTPLKEKTKSRLESGSESGSSIRRNLSNIEEEEDLDTLRLQIARMLANEESLIRVAQISGMPISASEISQRLGNPTVSNLFGKSIKRSRKGSRKRSKKRSRKLRKLRKGSRKLRKGSRRSRRRS